MFCLHVHKCLCHAESSEVRHGCQIPETGVKDNCYLYPLGPLKEQYVLLTAQPSLQPLLKTGDEQLLFCWGFFHFRIRTWMCWGEHHNLNDFKQISLFLYVAFTYLRVVRRIYWHDKNSWFTACVILILFIWDRVLLCGPSWLGTIRPRPDPAI